MFWHWHVTYVWTLWLGEDPGRGMIVMNERHQDDAVTQPRPGTCSIRTSLDQSWSQARSIIIRLSLPIERDKMWFFRSIILSLCTILVLWCWLDLTLWDCCGKTQEVVRGFEIIVHVRGLVFLELLTENKHNMPILQIVKSEKNISHRPTKKVYAYTLDETLQQ